MTVRRLLAAFGSAEAVLKAGVRELSAVEGVGSSRAKAIKDFKGREGLEKKVDALMSKGITVAALGSPDYPGPLKDLADAPLVVYIKGAPIAEDRYAMAVVGSRKPTPYGLSVTETIVSELSSMGFTVVSGLARGIDTAAHVASVKDGGRGIAVLGSGIDVPYPPENKGLLERISSSGYVISEFPPETPPNRENFPRRNRLISGLSLGVLVVEAAADSGALITADCALRQGKEVFSVPGNINSAVSSGTNELIKQGAKPVLGARDILEELAPVLKGFIKCREKVRPPVSDEEKALLSAIGLEPRHIDDISREAGVTARKALAVLLSLELKGVVRQSEGKRFHLV